MASVAAAPPARIQCSHLDQTFVAGLDWNKTLLSKDFCRHRVEVSNIYDTSLGPLCLVAKSSASDNPAFSQAVNGLDAD
eukprot:8529955-Ditylum_brightwellii.AAC.3